MVGRKETAMGGIPGGATLAMVFGINGTETDEDDAGIPPVAAALNMAGGGIGGCIGCAPAGWKYMGTG